MSAAVYKSAAAGAEVEAEHRRVLAQWPVPKTELLLETRCGRTFVLACGPEGAPPVVLLHGSQANSAAWLPEVVLWSQQFRLYAIDMIGEAGLSAPVRPPLAGEAHALWLDDVLAGLGLTQAALVGTSLGGWLALDYASRRPAAVRALCLICPAGIGRQKNFLLRALPLMLLGSWGKRKVRELVFGSAPEVPSPELEAIGPLMEHIGRTVRPRVVRIPQLSDAQLQALRVPVLAIVGGRDVLLDSAETRDRLLRHAPRAEVVFIADGRHFLPGQGPRIMAFLERTVQGAQGQIQTR
ncbi:MAG TPA: alpha/beta hydrolase [Devosiaceae bacterium]|jgi:pimeloyl-ACP methyl ester carboxylesterase|nr:alpha/beta hydrolase [Devosiaceae bacterium]